MSIKLSEIGSRTPRRIVDLRGNDVVGARKLVTHPTGGERLFIALLTHGIIRVDSKQFRPG